MTIRNVTNSTATLSMGGAMSDITPPLEVGLLTSSVERKWMPFEGVRKPLYARVVVLEGESPRGTSQRIAIVALDLLALSGNALGDFRELKMRIAAAGNHAVQPDDIVLACTHTHSSPESGAITDLFKTAAFDAWAANVIEQIGEAIAAAVDDLTECRVSYATTTAHGLGVHRRIKTKQGIMMSHPEPDDDVILSREGAVDESVNVLSFRDAHGAVKGLIVNATCHPVYEMCVPQVSPDYPGELTSLLDQRYPGALSLFLNGAAGNVNPNGVSTGAKQARVHAEKLRDAVCAAVDQSETEQAPYVQLRRASFEFDTRLPHGEDIGVTLPTEVIGVRIGSAAIMFIPGEPFAETALAIRQASVFDFTAVVGFSEETVGYIPTDEAFDEGGYEASFGAWSVVARGSESRLRRQAIALLEQLMVGVDEPPTVAPTPHLLGDLVQRKPDLTRTASKGGGR
jgi:neutral ceramidase